ncbi:MAG: Asp-tRNA(Asn)/Glu-tRNA(Gln) amidotransferase subunit GatB [Candidatus Levybacteria bacterium]|nr:Asp-tRNA(Asn)/Glu-tRNA(Gln) amidotransferase subunit GatB [Candidatus Levybacteria bacterium]
MKHRVIIGLEVHVELKTRRKMFCNCSAQYFGQEPNTHTCPVCLGLPGALPVANRKAIQWCTQIGMALNCSIPSFSKFDRKNYFYPDLPKGYQISQYDEPFCLKGEIAVNGAKIGITRVHMEEDTGKLLHETVDGEKVSLIDFNRSGVPLVEIVTEPDFDNAKNVKAYLQKLQQIVRYLGVSDADMEKGQMRLEPNISISLDENSKSLPKYKVEVKNINSFSFVEKAINFEIKRQLEILERGETPVQETRGWDETKQKTVTQRVKEEANDYRYFPEPDIPPIKWNEKELAKLNESLPELPDEKLNRFIKQYRLSDYNAEILTREIDLADYFEEAVKLDKAVTPKQIANHIINKKVNINNVFPAKLIAEILSSSKIEDVSREDLIKIIKEVLAKNPKIRADYALGNESVLQFAIGQVMYVLRKKIDVNHLRNLIVEELK